MSIVASLSAPFWLDSPARRYPPLEGDERCDVVVVGGGVSGLSCARTLAEAGQRVRLLEARRVASGASGRNGGFALRGLALPYAAHRDAGLMRLTEQGLERLAELAGDAFRRAGSLYVAADEEELGVVRAEHDALRDDGFGVEWIGQEALPGALRPHYLGGLLHPRDGLLDPGRWSRGLAELAVEAGVQIGEESRAVALEGTTVRTAAGSVAADAVVLATDGYTHGLVPELDELVAPARNQVLATVPLAERYFEPAVYARYGYDYWQQARDGRIVIGGRRDVALETEATREEATTPLVQDELEALLTRLLGYVPDITHRWAGLLGFTPDRLPLVGSLPGRDAVWCALGYSGHGNVLALVCGEGVGQAVLGRPDPRLEAFRPERILGAPARA